MRTILLIGLLFVNGISFSQKWTKQQLDSANTAKNINYLSQIEKDIIMYINLARLYPQLFIIIELEDYNGEKGCPLDLSEYKNSLKYYLKVKDSVCALLFSKHLFENAKCFAKESSKYGIIGHNRKYCKKENYEECCSYGMKNGKDIILQLLIDFNNSAYGHRRICLDGKYTKIGVSFIPYHKKWGSCAVLNFSH